MDEQRIDVLGRIVDRERMDRDHHTDPYIYARNEMVYQLVMNAMRSVVTSGGVTEPLLVKTTEEIIKLFYPETVELVEKPVKYCTLAEFQAQSEYGLICITHKKRATHCGPDGDSRVCEDFVKEHGCNCCPKNYDKN